MPIVLAIVANWAIQVTHFAYIAEYISYVRFLLYVNSLHDSLPGFKNHQFEMNQNQIDGKYLKSWITKFIQTSEQKPQPETTLPYWNGI